MNEEIKQILKNQLVLMEDVLFISKPVKEQIKKTKELFTQSKTKKC